MKSAKKNALKSKKQICAKPAVKKPMKSKEIAKRDITKQKVAINKENKIEKIINENPSPTKKLSFQEKIKQSLAGPQFTKEVENTIKIKKWFR